MKKKMKLLNDPNIVVKGGHVYTEEVLYSIYNKSAGPFIYTDEKGKSKTIDPNSTRKDVSEYEKEQIVGCGAYKEGLVCLVDADFKASGNQFTEDSLAELIKKYNETKEAKVVTNFIDGLNSQFACEDLQRRLGNYPDLPQYFTVYTQTKLEEMRMNGNHG